MEGKPTQPDARDQLSLIRQRRTARIKIITFGVVLLLSGILMGAGGMFFWGRTLVLQNIRRGADLAAISARLEEKLDLNSDQKQKVEEILGLYMPKIREIRKSKYLAIRQEIETMKEEIGATLDERQTKIWEEQVDQIMSYRSFKRHNRHRPASPPGTHPMPIKPSYKPGPGMESPPR